MVDSGQVRESWAISFRLTAGQNRCGGKLDLHWEARIKAPAQHPHVTSEDLAIYLEDGTEAICLVLLQVAVCVLWLAPCSCAHAKTHTQ